MTEIFKDTDFKTPLVFILSVGADPLGNIEKLAKEKGTHNNKISLG